MAQKRSSKLGRNPFEKKGKSRVGRMIEGSFSTSSEESPQKVQERSLLERIQEMKISLDLRDFFKSVKDHTL